jgi:uncharacterized protein YbbC (DUF1343 family)
MIQGERWITNRCNLTVIPLQGWRRTMSWTDTRLPWVPTSPNVRTIEAVYCLPTMGVAAEVGGFSIGFGTPLPFQVCGATWLDGRKTAAELSQRGLRGLRFDPWDFTPDRGAFAGKKVHGFRLRITDPVNAPLAAVNLHLLEAIKKVGRRDLFAEARKAGRSFDMMDKINGTDATRKALERGLTASNIVAGWKPGEDAFRNRRQRYLLY